MQIAPQTKTLSDGIDDPPARPISVVHVVLALNMGGLENVVFDLVRLSDSERFSTRVVCLGEVGALGPKFASIGVRVEALDALKYGTVRRIRTLARRLRELKPDVVHTHNPCPHLIGALASWLAGVPVVVHTKHGRNIPHNAKTVFGNRIASWFSKKVVPVSDDAAEIVRNIEKVPAAKVEVIHNGIDLERYAFGSRRAQGDRWRAIHVARLDNVAKDQQTLIRAVRLVVDAEQKFVLDIVGDGPARGDLEALCDELAVRPHVNFLGFRNDVHGLLAESQCFVLSSITEGISLALLEAAASGLPIVATSVGGNPEVVADGKNGFLVPPRSPEAMARAILMVLRDPHLADQMGQAGRRHIEERFDLRRTVTRYEQLYEELTIRKDRR